MSDDFEIANPAFFRGEITPYRRDPVLPSTMRRTNLGRDHWKTQIKQIPDECPYKHDLQQLIDNLHIDHEKGKGAIFYGDQGQGKSCAAGIILKEAIARGGQGYFLYATALEAAYDRPQNHLTPEGIPVWEMATRCHFFVLDDLGGELHAAGYKAGNTQAVESLIRARYSNRLPTYITTNLAPAKWVEFYPSFVTILTDTKRFKSVKVFGKNWRFEKETS